MHALIAIFLPMSSPYLCMHVAFSYKHKEGSLMQSLNRPDLEYYSQQSELSSPGHYASLLDGLPGDVDELCKVIQGIIIHAFWISEENYRASIETLKKQRHLIYEYNLRSMEDILEVIVKLDERPLTEHRPADKRVIGNSRDFALFLTSVLRRQGIPARVRRG
jgi:hypothetical protein